MEAGISMRKVAGKGFGASVLLFLLSAVAGIAVTLFLVVSLNPLVALFPPTSGAREVAYGIALMWGVVVAATVGVFSFGSFRRMQRQKPDYYDPNWQSRFVPAAPAACPAPVHFAPPAPRKDAALEQHLRQIEALVAANHALVERLERAATPRAYAPTQGAPQGMRAYR
jgi:hypothetical protein